MPTIKGASDTRHFPDYSENDKLFKISDINIHEPDFKDF